MASRALRLITLARTLARHDALWLAEPLADRSLVARLALASVKALWGPRRARSGERPGQRLAAALTELGPSFIKLGQALSVRADLVGRDVADDLTRLQDRLEPFESDVAIATVERELAAPLADRFAAFDRTPVAAASIAQVHFAVTQDGKEVAVKILRPGVERQLADDISLFRWLAGVAERIAPTARRLRLREVVDTFEEWVRIETDLRLEGAAASELKENCDGDEGFHVPGVEWELTAQRVLTTERLYGCRVDDLDALKAMGHEPEEVLARSARVFFLQVFRDGFFHADMHPGNMFVAEDGRLCPVDFGIMGRVSHDHRVFLADTLVGFLNRDYAAVADAHFRAGFVPPTKSRELFTQALRSIGEPMLDKPLSEISIARLLQHLFETTERFEMRTQPALLLLQKTMLVAEGVGRRLNPDTNMWLLARPLIEDWMIANRGPEARLANAVRETGALFDRLPKTLNRAEDILARLEKRGLETPSGGIPWTGIKMWAPAVGAVALVLLVLVSGLGS